MKNYQAALSMGHRAGMPALVLLFTAVLAMPARAQDLPLLADVPRIIAPAAGSERAESVDLSSRPQSWWEDARKATAKALDSRSTIDRAEGLRTIIYFASYYPGQARLHNLSRSVYHLYRHDPDEDVRIMALAAASRMGDRELMRQIAAGVNQEASPRVKRVTRLVLADYFGDRRK